MGSVGFGGRVASSSGSRSGSASSVSRSGLRWPDANTMTNPALISVKASLTRMTPLLAGVVVPSRSPSCPLNQSASGQWERSCRFSLRLAQLGGTRCSDPPKSTSSSKLPVHLDPCPMSMAAKFLTLRDFDSLTGGPGCCCVAFPVSTDRALLCAGAIGLLGISSGCRHTSAGGSCPVHDSHSS